MNRRQINHVEAHGRDIGKPLPTVAESSMAPSLSRARSRKYFVPCREARLFAIDGDIQFLLVSARQVMHRISLNNFESRFFERNRCAFRLGRGSSQPHCPFTKKL